MVSISKSMKFAHTSHTPNNVHLRLTLRGALRSQSNVLSRFKQAERRFSVSKWHPIMVIVFFIVCKIKPPASVSGSRVVH
jgi:hypothetical protein